MQIRDIVSGPDKISTAAKKKSSFLDTARVNLRCSSCRKPKLSDVYHPKPITKYPTEIKHEHCISRTRNKEDGVRTRRTTSRSSPLSGSISMSSQVAEVEACMKSTTTVKGCGRIRGEVTSVAVEMESDDPYLDFRYSMLEMILENDIYSRDGLRQLLSCFLQLNSPYHHGAIVKAFTEISDGVYIYSVENSSSDKLDQVYI